MDNTIQKTLTTLGLSPKEVRIFETSFRLGPSTTNEIAKHSRLQRSTAYLITEGLILKGFLEENINQGKKKITAIEPVKLLRMISAKQRILRRQELELEEALPTLQVQYQSSEVRPRVRVFEGIDGLLQIWKDILSTKNEILIWTNQKTERVGSGVVNRKFIEDRIKKGIKNKSVNC